MKSIVFALLLTVLIPLAQAQQNNCDCTQITGSCEAVIMVQPTESTKGSFGADLHIRSTAPICSKVDYYVDSTPYFTVLSQGNSFTDRVFGTSPVTKDTISDIRCRTCKIVTASIAPSDAKSQQPLQEKSVIAGTWIGDGGTYNFSAQGDRFAGSYKADARSDSLRVVEGSLSGESFSFRVPSDYGGRNVTHSCKFNNPGSASCSWQATGGSNPLIFLLAPKSGTFELQRQ